MVRGGRTRGTALRDTRRVYTEMSLQIAPRASSRGHHDLSSKPGKQRPALGINHRFGALDLGPFAVASHRGEAGMSVLWRVLRGGQPLALTGGVEYHLGP